MASEREFADRARAVLQTSADLDMDVLLANATSFGISERRARMVVERIRRSDGKPTHDEGLPDFEPAADFLAKPHPPARWIVPDFIPANTIGCIAGPSFSGKTLVALWALVAGARLGARMAYVGEEGTAEDLQHRMRAAGLDDELPVAIMFQKGARLDDAKWVQHWVERLQGYDVCFFDTFGDVTGVDQLEQKAMLEVFKAVRAIRVATGCTIVLLMHTPKAIFRGDTAPSMADVFGSVVAVNVMDFVHLLRVMREEDEPVEGKVELHCAKLRAAGSAPPKPRAGEIVSQELEDGRTTAFFRLLEGASPRDAKLQARTEKYRRQVLDFVREHRVASANAVFEGLGGKRGHVTQAVKDLLAIGRITMGPTGYWGVVPAGTQVVPHENGYQGRPGIQLVPAGVPIKAPGYQGTGALTPHPEPAESEAVVPDEMGTGPDPMDGFDT